MGLASRSRTGESGGSADSVTILRLLLRLVAAVGEGATTIKPPTSRNQLKKRRTSSSRVATNPTVAFLPEWDAHFPFCSFSSLAAARRVRTAMVSWFWLARPNAWASCCSLSCWSVSVSGPLVVSGRLVSATGLGLRVGYGRLAAGSSSACCLVGVFVDRQRSVSERLNRGGAFIIRAERGLNKTSHAHG